MDERASDRQTVGAIRPDPGTPEGRDALLARIVDAEADHEDWRSFRRVAEQDPDVWKELAEAQRQHELLCEGVRAAAACADRVDLPRIVSDGAPLQRRLDAVGRWGGWAAAAALVLVWATGAPTIGGGGSPTGVQPAGLLGGGPALSEATPDEALERYLDAGRNAGLVVGEVPERLVVETTPRADGSVEVVYLRQIIERRVTDRVYRETVDETGRAVAVPMPTGEIQRVRAY